MSLTARRQQLMTSPRAHDADRIVAEQNNGGEMVQITLRTEDKQAPVRLVRASRGKITRAEPVSALYEQGKVRHCGFFPELEDQMTSYTGAPGCWAHAGQSEGRGETNSLRPCFGPQCRAWRDQATI